MSRRRVLAAGFKHHGRETLSTTQLVAAIALERGWYEPETVRTIVEQARAAGELEGTDDALSPTFEVGSVTIPSDYEPPVDLGEEPAPFERVVKRLEEAGHDKRDAVAGINQLQSEAATTGDTAAILYAHGLGVDVSDEAERLVRQLEGELG